MALDLDLHRHIHAQDRQVNPSIYTESILVYFSTTDVARKGALTRQARITKSNYRYHFSLPEKETAHWRLSLFSLQL